MELNLQIQITILSHAELISDFYLDYDFVFNVFVKMIKRNGSHPGSQDRRLKNELDFPVTL